MPRRRVVNLMLRVEDVEYMITVYPDRAVFAEDVVNYIINDVWHIDFRTNGAERFREYTCSSFSATVKEGVDHILETEGDRRLNGDELNTWDQVTYVSTAARLERMFLREGLEPLQFLHFCIQVTLLAREFMRYGLSHAPILASAAIYELLVHYDMFSGGWDSLDLAAKNITDCDKSPMTPDTSSTDASENDLRHSISLCPSSDISNDGAEYDLCTVSDESQHESRMHAGLSEDASFLNEHSYCRNYQPPNVSIGIQRAEATHDFRSCSMREKNEAVVHQEDVKDVLKGNEPVADEIYESPVSTNGKRLQEACKSRKTVEVDKSSRNEETV